MVQQPKLFHSSQNTVFIKLSTTRLFVTQELTLQFNPDT